MIYISTSSPLPGIEHACVVILDLQNMHAHPVRLFHVVRLYRAVYGRACEERQIKTAPVRGQPEKQDADGETIHEP